MSKILSILEERARERTCLALDVPTTAQALSLAEELSPYFGSMKLGKETHTIAGNEGIPIVREIYEAGTKVFLDLKLHDTPQTVLGAAKACTVPGVYMFNLHIAGGEKMCKSAIEGAYNASQTRNIPRPKVIGVTVLTSLDDNDLREQNLGISYDDLVMKRTELAKKWGLDGIVCPANKARELVIRFGSDFTYVTPGIEWKGKQGTGQKQLYTPDRAVIDCSSSILVIGSAVTKAENRIQTAYDILQAMANNLKA
jgi:orotidine-5'-phosphate decarboxylase